MDFYGYIGSVRLRNEREVTRHIVCKERSKYQIEPKKLKNKIKNKMKNK